MNSPLLQIHRHHAPAQWARAACAAIAGSLAGRGPQRLLLSGGSTPAPVYQRLATTALDWEQLTLCLADERWLPDGDANRNDVLIAEHLLARQAHARLRPLARFADGLQACVNQANAHWHSHPGHAVVVLGMGNDSHTASLFPGASNLDQAINSPLPYAAIDAHGCPGAQQFPLRISLTPAGLAACRQRFLLLRGQDKLDTLQAALAANDPTRHPILHALAGAEPLQVYWCA